MDLLSIGSANQYAKNMARRTMWDLKKRSGDFTSHATSLRDYVNITKASSVLPQTDEADKKMSAILTKSQAGKKLSPDEWEYLRAKNPTLYEKLREVEREQENYEKALKRCKTRDEAQRLHVSKLGEILSAAKNGDESALYRLNRLTRTMTEFTKSEEYHKMPTEAEEAIERESERQARVEALREEAEVREAEKEATFQDAQEAEAVSEPDADANAESVSDTDADAEGKSVPKPDADRKPQTVSKGKADVKPQADFKTESDAKPRAVRNGKDAAHTESGVASHVSPRTESGKASHTESPKASAAPFGQQAYLNQMGAERPRRRAIDAKACRSAP